MSHIESQKRKRLDGPQKVAVLKRYLVDKTPISDLCDEYGIQPSQVYQWQKVLFENGAAAFQRKRKGSSRSPEAQKLEKLEAKLTQKNEVLAELMQEHVELKKGIGEL